MLKFLREKKIRLDKRKGQHLMLDSSVLERMVEYAQLSKSDTVLEIGAGVGNLTRLLAERAGRVIAIEKDRRLCEVLKEELSDFRNVEILQGDFMKLQLPPFDKVVSNPPFQISSGVVFRLLEQPFKLAVMTFQKEFAERLVAEVGTPAYSRMTVSVHLRAEVELLEEIPPSCFFPKPKVSASIVRMRPRAEPIVPRNPEGFERVLRALFSHKNQKVRNALLHSDLWEGSKREKRDAVDSLPLRFLERRPVDLSPEEIVELSNLIFP